MVLTNVFILRGDSTIADIIFKCSAVTIKPSDDNRFVCDACIGKLLIARDIRNQCIVSEIRLKQVVRTDRSSVISIKTETEEDNDADTVLNEFIEATGMETGHLTPSSEQSNYSSNLNSVSSRNTDGKEATTSTKRKLRSSEIACET